MSHATPLLPYLAMACAGMVFGAVYFATLKLSIVRLITGCGWLVPIVLTLGRIAAAVAFLGIAGRFGAGYLVAAFAGFLTARGIALRIERRTA